MVEPNVVGGWDVRAEDTTTRHSRHSTRDDAVAAARALGDGDVVVRGMRGEELDRFHPPDSRKSPSEGATARSAPPAGPKPDAAKPPAAAKPAAQSTGRRPGMRLAQLLALSDQTDEAGRLLLEDSAPPQAIRKAERAGIPMQTVPAPYEDTPSRLGGPMNQSAYEALRHDVAAILNGFAWLAEQHRAKEPEATGAPRRLFVTSYLGVTLAHFLFHRAENPMAPHGELPAYVASIFKASRGIFSFSVQLENDLGPDAPMTAADVMTYAEEKRQLVRPETGRVCAAPTRLIERTIDAILTGRGADASKSGLPDLVDFDRLWEFYELQDRIGEALSGYRVVLEHLSATGVADDPRRLMSAVVPDGPAKGQPFGRYTESLLALLTDLQAGMNRALGRAENARSLTFEDLVRML